MKWIAMLVIATLLSACGQSRSEPRPLVASESRSLFNHWIVDATPPGGVECCTDVMAVGDINGDGFADVVVGAEKAKDAGLVWYEYPTWQRHDIAKGEFTTDGRMLDVDGDGDLDIMIGELNDGLVWYEQSEAGRRWVKHHVGAGYVHDVAVADLDSDGTPDAVVTDKKGVHVFFSMAREPRRVEIVARKGEGLQTSDVDGDGDLDLLYSNVWIEQRRSAGATDWRVHEIDPSWDPDTRIQLADVNGDGRLDVILSGSEGESRLAWMEAPPADASGPWTRHYIGEETFVGAHSLRAADFDLDGTVDVLVAEMSTSARKRIVMYLNKAAGGEGWEAVPLAMHGSHNMVAADVDGDGDMDLLGKNYEGAGRFVEYWENRTADLRLAPAVARASTTGKWRYAPIDSERPAEDRHKFGLLVADIDQDGRPDVVAGGSVYLAPATLDGKWRRFQAAPQLDIIHVTSQRHHGWPALLAVGSESLEVLQAQSSTGASWDARKLHGLPAGHTQGYMAGPSTPDGEYDLYFTHATSLFQLHVTAEPPEQWRFARVWDNVQEEAVAVADLDGEGRQDLVLVDADGKRLLWLEPDGRGWRRARYLGASLHWIDRVAIADLNNDGRLDVIYTEETQDWDYNARLVWLEAPADRLHQPWRTHVVTVLRSINSLSVHDVDRDGSADLLFAEHTDMRPDRVASDNFTGILHNRGDGTFVTEVVEIGPHASHLGAQLLDPGGVAPLQIVSTGWEQACCVHRWIAPAVPPSE